MSPKKPLILTLVAVILLVGGIALFYVFENYRGRKALEETVARMKAAGHLADWDEEDPDRPADEDNFYMAPFVSSLVDAEIASDELGNIVFNSATERRELLDLEIPFSYDDFFQYYPATGLEGIESGEGCDLELWKVILWRSGLFEIGNVNGNAPAEVLGSIENSSPGKWELLDHAASRNGSYVPSENIDLDFLGLYRAGTIGLSGVEIRRVLAVRFIAALEAGDEVKAQNTFEIFSKLLEGRIACESPIIAIEALMDYEDLLCLLWDGIERGGFSKRQLQYYMERLKRQPFDEYILRAMSGVSTMGLNCFENLKWDRENIDYYDIDSKFERIIEDVFQFVPNGWIDLNSATLLTVLEAESIQPFKDRDFSKLMSFSSRLSKRGKLETFLVPGRLNIRRVENLMFVFVAKELAQISCAVEIYEKDLGQFPETLSDLVPEYLEELPIDPFSQSSYLYKQEGGRYVIYSVGPDLDDDGGKMGRRDMYQNLPDDGDWSWNFDLAVTSDRLRKRSEAIMRFLLEEEQSNRLSDEEFLTLSEWLETEQAKSEEIATQLEAEALKWP